MSEPPKETEAAVEEAVRRLRNETAWRQWALDHAVIRGRAGTLEATFAEAEEILAWMFKRRQP